MVDQLDAAREAVRRAVDLTDHATVRKQLRSIDEGLMEMTERDGSDDDGAKTEWDAPRGDDLEEMEAKLVGLADETGEAARGPIVDARNADDVYRRNHARDW